MQLGARWRAGEPPHRSVPESLHAAIAELEAAHPGASSWTLTWLEGRPRCALDDMTVLTLDSSGAPVAEVNDVASVHDPMRDDADDDWLN